jgi:tRNA/tmRNA/rRNA uracil-C5-methylase (TrmA/RlmC/RlmD family)
MTTTPAEHLPVDPEVLTLVTGDIAGGGGCVARGPDGRVVFVRHALPGETVLAEVTASTTSFLRADAIEVLVPSPDRVEPSCTHAGPGKCGGCDFQHVRLEAQRQLKADRIADQLRRVAGIERTVEVEPVPGDQRGLAWRTRIRAAVDEEGRTGFRRHRSHEVEVVDHCPVAHPGIEAIGIFDASWREVTEFEAIVATDGSDPLITTYTRYGTRPRFPELAAGLVVNGKVNKEPGFTCNIVDGITFRVSAGVFWQVHPGAGNALSKAVRSGLQARPGDRVVDLYSGAGLFSVLLALEVGTNGSVLAVERDRHACDDASFNGRGYPQIEIRKANVSPKLVELGIGSPDLMVLDPSREGAGKGVMAAIAHHATTLRRLAYVSCDPSSFSRDIRVLLNSQWTIRSLRAFDIFPMTEHVELVAIVEPPAI